MSQLASWLRGLSTEIKGENSSNGEQRGGTLGKQDPCKNCNSAALIFLSIDTNWQQNAFLTSLLPSAPPACERDELPTPEIIPNLAGKDHQGLEKSAGT